MAIKFLNTVDTDVAFVSKGGSYSATIDTKTDVAISVLQNNKIYSETSSGYLRNLMYHDSNGSIQIGQDGTALITDIIMKPGTSGNVIFRTQSNSETVRISSNGNVGIGTTSPGSKLTVATSMLSGGTDFDFLQLAFNGGWIGNVGGLAAINFTDSITSTNTVGRIGVTYTGSQGKFVVTDLYSGGYGASGDVFTIQADGQTYIKGNVGIGTTSPSQKLEVDEGYINVTGAGTSHGYELERDGFDTYRLRHLDGGLTIYNSTDARKEMTFDGAGNVGIGTTSPSQKLEVSTDAEIVSKFVGNTDDGTGFVGAVVEIETNNDARGRGIYLTHRDSSDTSDSEWYMGTPYNGGGLSIGNAAYGTSVNSATGPAHKDQSKLFVTEAGNVGIGTTTPDAKLDISQGAGGTAQNVINSGEVAFRFSTKVEDTSINTAVFRQGIYYNNVENATIAFYRGSSTVGGFLTFTTNNGNERMRITSAGNVGIGDTSPSYPLAVNGTSAANKFYVPNVTATTAWAFQARNSANTADSGLYFENGDAQLLLRDDSNNLNVRINADTNSYINGGSLGLGTTSPNLKLDVISGTNNGIRISATDTTSNWRDIDIRSYVSQAQANALPDGSAIYTTNPASQTETAFSKFGGLVLQGRDDGNSSFAIRLGNGNGYATRMFMGATGATVFSNTVTATNFILSSDERLKENVEKVCDNRVKADWKTFELKTEKGEKRYGVIAQELEENHPEFVKTDDEGFKSVKYIDLLIAKIAELEARLEKLEK